MKEGTAAWHIIRENGKDARCTRRTELTRTLTLTLSQSDTIDHWSGVSPVCFVHSVRQPLPRVSGKLYYCLEGGFDGTTLEAWASLLAMLPHTGCPVEAWRSACRHVSHHTIILKSLTWTLVTSCYLCLLCAIYSSSRLIYYSATCSTK